MAEYRVRVVAVRWCRGRVVLVHLRREVAVDAGGRRRRRRRRRWSRPWNDESIHAEALQRKLDRGVDFAGGFRLAGGEALEMDDEDMRETCQDDLFGRFPLTSAGRTLPHLVARQSLFLTIRTQTVLQSRRLAGGGNLDANAVEGFIGGGGAAAAGTSEPRGVLSGKQGRDEARIAVLIT